MWLVPDREESTPAQRWAWFMEKLTPLMAQRLLAEAQRITGSAHEAEDVLQEAMIAGVIRCWQIRDEERFFRWMHAIVQHIAWQRENQRIRAMVCALRMAVHLLPHQPAADEVVMTDLQRNAMLRAIEELPWPEKEIMALHATTEMNNRQIAQRLGLNYNTVRSKYQRTLKRLEKELGVSE